MTAIALPVTITPPFEPRANGVTARSISPAPRTSTGLEAKAYARMQRSRSQHFGSIVYEWRLGKGAYRIVGNGPVHRSTHFVGPEKERAGHGWKFHLETAHRIPIRELHRRAV
jgi:hypothetical protein